MPNARRSARGEWIALAVLISLPLVLTCWGAPCYLAPVEERVRSDLHRLLRASGPVGQGPGLAALAMFLFMWLYPIRKSVRAFARIGSLATWLRVHVVIGLALPLVAGVHAGWRFQGLVGLGYLSMVIVCGSGVIGRWLYASMPRRRDGLDMSREEVISRRRTLTTDIAARLDLTPLEVEHALESIQRPTAARVREIRAEDVVLDVRGESEAVPNDYVIVRIGGVAPYGFLQQIGMRIVTRELAVAPAAAAAAGA